MPSLTLVLHGLVVLAAFYPPAVEAAQTEASPDKVQLGRALDRVREGFPADADDSADPVEDQSAPQPVSDRLLSDDEVIAMLAAEGYAGARSIEPGWITFKMAGLNILLIVYDDGTLQARMIMTGGDYTLPLVNEWNLRKRYSKAYVNAEGSIVLESDLFPSGELTQQQFSDFLANYRLSLSDFRTMLRERPLSSDGRSPRSRS